MTSEIIYVDENSEIPLYGVDFIGIIDRGTNIIELKPITLCNLKCKYCFVSAGDFETNFIVSSSYIIEKLKDMIDIKGHYDIEIHIAPYGESLLYSELFSLIKSLWEIDGVKIVSMQSNGLLLTPEMINKLENVNLTRINLSLNTLNKEKAEKFCACNNYAVDTLIENIYTLLNSNIDVLIAPVWFPGRNDKDIEEIIIFINDLRNQGYSERKIQIGIQKYLIYKTGRKLKNVNPKTWGYFYKQLSRLEKKYTIKLKLGPIDFGIHKRKRGLSLNFKKNDKVQLKIISKGRWKRECIGKITNDIGIKVLLRDPIVYSSNLKGKKIEAKVIKANYKDNIITAIFPP